MEFFAIAFWATLGVMSAYGAVVVGAAVISGIVTLIAKVVAKRD